jgi:hypothetical protein
MGRRHPAFPAAATRGHSLEKEAEQDGATKTWLRLPFESGEVLYHRLHTWSQCEIHRLAGLLAEPLVELLMEPAIFWSKP